MDQLKKSDLSQLAEMGTEEKSARLVSLFSPMYRAGREVQQNDTRFKNLIKSAREQLSQCGCYEDDIDTMLVRAEELLADDNFWQHQSDGLAVFIGNDFFKSFRLPADFDELAVVGNSFHLQPLTQLLTDDHLWYIIAASPKRVRLFEASMHSIAELQPDDFPDNLRDALNIDEYVSTLQFHSSDGRLGNAAIHHGQGASDPDIKKKDELLQYFHRLNTALNDYFADESRPLLFAGVEYLFPIFKEASKYNGLVEDTSITGNPDDVSAEELHAKSIEIMEAKIRDRRTSVLGDFNDKAHTDWASDDPQTLYQAAEMGQIDTLIVDPEKQHWFKSVDGRIEQLDENSAEAEDLFNSIAVKTLAAGGRVVAIKSQDEKSGNDEGASRDALPSSGIAAIFRSPVESYVQ